MRAGVNLGISQLQAGAQRTVIAYRVLGGNILNFKSLLLLQYLEHQNVLPTSIFVETIATVIILLLSIAFALAAQDSS